MTPPSQVGHYRITAELGAGGMGIVYRATDTRLNRDVAIKILPERLACDADYAARFQREAQLLAAMNHPNIAGIHGLEGNAIIMELVEGETLQTPLPVQEALTVARQIAEALEAAHDKGIIHRDLKPGNIKVTPEGVVKVLDFGLAKAVETSSPATTADSPTLSLHATEAGLIMGTAGYMSPEQAAGKPVDKRADIWSFGVVLYELLTGRRLFQGETVSHTLADVLRAPIHLESLPRETPPSIRELLERCLDRRVRNRLRDIGEARVVIDRCLEGPVQSEAPVRRLRFHWPAAILLALAAALTTGLVVWRTMRPNAPPLVQLSVQPGPEYAPSLDAPSAILSPDGTRLVYTGTGGDKKNRLYTRLLREETSTPINGTEGAAYPFFSPDGEWVGFFSGSKLRKTSVRGGSPQVLCDAPLPQGGSWGADGNIVAALASSGVLSRIASDGGQPQPVTKLNGDLTHRWPQVLSEGNAVLFTAHTAGLAFDDAKVEWQSLKTGERKTIVQGGTFGRYTPSRHLLYVRQGVLLAAPMDLPGGRLTGPSVPVAEGVAQSPYGAASFDVSGDGTLVYRKATGARQTLRWLDHAGKIAPFRSNSRGPESALEFSPDGRYAAVVVTEAGNPDIWVHDLDREVETRLTSTPGLDGFPKWAPDGKHLLFSSVRHGGPQNLYWMRADGAGEAFRLTKSDAVHIPAGVSSDGKYVIYTAVSPQTGYDIWMLPIDSANSERPSAGSAEPFLVTQFNEGQVSLSPDGRWAVYDSNESGDLEIYVKPFPGPGGKWRVASGGGRRGRWLKREKALLYLGGAGIMMVPYSVETGNFSAGKPRLWAELSGIVDFDPFPDGRRAAVLVNDGSMEPQSRQVVFTFGFADQLRRLASAK